MYRHSVYQSLKQSLSLGLLMLAMFLVSEGSVEVDANAEAIDDFETSVGSSPDESTLSQSASTTNRHEGGAHALLPIIHEVANFLQPDQREGWQQAATQVSSIDRFGPILLDQFSQIEPQLLDQLVTGSGDSVPDWLTDENTEYAAINPSLRLAMAEQFFFQEKYERCLLWCEELDEDSIYSQELLFYLRVVAAYLTVDYEQAKEALSQLSEGHENFGLARRQTLESIQRALSKKQPEKLNVVAHRMEDVVRRLSLRQGNQLTQDQQQRVIDDLDELIKKMEEEQKQKQQASNSNATPSGTPAEESRAGEYKGPGQVDRKRFSAGDAWGALSPAERERLSQGIDRDFPGHYRSLIEGYYQRLAETGEAGDDRQFEPDRKQGSDQ